MSMNGAEYASLAQDLNWESVRVASAISGRVRLKSAQLRGDENLAARIREALGAVDVITEVAVNARTGSVLLHYDEQLGDPPILIDRAAAAGMLPMEMDPEDLKAMAEGHANGAASRDFNLEARRVFNSMDASVKEATGGAMDLAGLVPLSLFGMGTYRLISGAATQPLPWFNYFWFAFSIFVALEAGKSPDKSPPAEEARTNASVSDAEPATSAV